MANWKIHCEQWEQKGRCGPFCWAETSRELCFSKILIIPQRVYYCFVFRYAAGCPVYRELATYHSPIHIACLPSTIPEEPVLTLQTGRGVSAIVITIVFHLAPNSRNSGAIEYVASVWLYFQFESRPCFSLLVSWVAQQQRRLWRACFCSKGSNALLWL